MGRGLNSAAYAIDYEIRGSNFPYSVLIDARDLKSAKRKIGRKHGYKDGRMVKIVKCSVVGYF